MYSALSLSPHSPFPLTIVTPLTVTINQPKATRSSSNGVAVSRKSVINLLFSINYPLRLCGNGGNSGLCRTFYGTPKTLLNKFQLEKKHEDGKGGKKARETCKYFFSLAKMPKCSLAQATRDERALWDPKSTIRYDAIQENDPN